MAASANRDRCQRIIERLEDIEPGASTLSPAGKEEAMGILNDEGATMVDVFSLEAKPSFFHPDPHRGRWLRNLRLLMQDGSIDVYGRLCG